MAEDFFASETRLATHAIKALLKESRQKIATHTDIRPLIRQRPFTSLLASFAGGIVSGYLISPRRRTAAEKAAKQVAKATASGQRPAHASIQEHLLNTLKPAIGAFAAQAASALFQHRNQTGNHHHETHAHSDQPNALSEP